MAVSRTARLAADTRVPVFCVMGSGGRPLQRALRLQENIRLVRSPRHASVLLLAGDIAAEMADAVRHVHDQLPAPCGVLLWNCNETELFAEENIVRRESGAVPVQDILDLHRDLLEGKRARALFSDRKKIPFPGREREITAKAARA